MNRLLSLQMIIAAVLVFNVTAVLEHRHKRRGGLIEVIHAPGVGHHPR